LIIAVKLIILRALNVSGYYSWDCYNSYRIITRLLISILLYIGTCELIAHCVVNKKYVTVKTPGSKPVKTIGCVENNCTGHLPNPAVMTNLTTRENYWKWMKDNTDLEFMENSIKDEGKQYIRCPVCYFVGEKRILKKQPPVKDVCNFLKSNFTSLMVICPSEDCKSIYCCNCLSTGYGNCVCGKGTDLNDLNTFIQIMREYVESMECSAKCGMLIHHGASCLAMNCCFNPDGLDGCNYNCRHHGGCGAPLTVMTSVYVLIGTFYFIFFTYYIS
jgi:hypothetical protein